MAEYSWENKKVNYFPWPGKGEDWGREFYRSVERFHILGRGHSSRFEEPQKLLEAQYFEIFLQQDCVCLWWFLWWPLRYCGADCYLWWLRYIRCFVTPSLYQDVQLIKHSLTQFSMLVAFITLWQSFLVFHMICSYHQNGFFDFSMCYHSSLDSFYYLIFIVISLSGSFLCTNQNKNAKQANKWTIVHSMCTWKQNHQSATVFKGSC